MKLDALNPRVIEAYKNIAKKNLIVIDVMYENYLEKKRELQRQMASGERRVISHFSMNENDMSLYELFDDGDEDDELFDKSERAIDED